MKEMVCLNCIYRVKNAEKEHECHFMPPTMHLLVHPKKGPHLVSFFPRVDPRRHFCGQYHENTMEATAQDLKDIEEAEARAQAEKQGGADIVVPSKKLLIPPNTRN